MAHPLPLLWRTGSLPRWGLEWLLSLWGRRRRPSQTSPLSRKTRRNGNQPTAQRALPHRQVCEGRALGCILKSHVSVSLGCGPARAGSFPGACAVSPALTLAGSISSRGQHQPSQLASGTTAKGKKGQTFSQNAPLPHPRLPPHNSLFPAFYFSHLYCDAYH